MILDPKGWATRQGTNLRTTVKGGAEVVVGVAIVGAGILGVPATGGGSLTAVGVGLAILSGEGMAGKGIIDIANGTGAIDNKTAESGKQGTELATNPASAAVLLFTGQKTAQNIGTAFNVATGVRELSKRPEGLLDSISKGSALLDVFQGVREAVHQITTSPCSGCEHITP